jgi:hypothetical protein
MRLKIAAETLPAGTILRYELQGGFNGRDHQLDISDDHVARLHANQALAAATRLTPDESLRFDGLRARSASVRVAYGFDRNVADGVRTKLLFDGKGPSPLEPEVTDLMNSVYERVKSHAEIWGGELVIVGRLKGPTPPPQVHQFQLVVDRVLKQPEGLGVAPGAVIDVERGGARREPSQGRPLCWLVNGDVARTRGTAWRARWGLTTDLSERAVLAVLKEQRELAKAP